MINGSYIVENLDNYLDKEIGDVSQIENEDNFLNEYELNAILEEQ